MVNIPYLNLAPAGQQMPQLPVLQAARGQAAQAMGNVSSALNSQTSQTQSLLSHYLQQAQSQPQPQQSPQQTTVVLSGQNVTGIGGRQMQLDPTSFNITTPNIPQSHSVSSYLPSWLTDMF